MSQRENYALLMYYLREKLWRHAQVLAAEQAREREDYVYRLWRGFTLMAEGSYTDATYEFRNCEGKKEVHVAALVGLQVLHQRIKPVNQEQVDGLESQIQLEEGGATASALLQCSAVLWHCQDFTRAREFINKVIDRFPDYRDEYTSVAALRGWIDITCGRGAFIEKSISMFDKALGYEAEDSSLPEVDALMGKVVYLERKNQYQQAQELLDKCAVTLNFTPALLVKARQLLKVEDWDEACDLAARILARDPVNVEALVLQVLFLLVKDCRYVMAANTIADLFKALQAREPKNAQYFYTCSQCFARLSGSNSHVLGLTIQLAETACNIDPTKSDYMSEVAYQQMLRHDVRTAAVTYKKSSNDEDGNITPLLGMIRCNILTNKLQEAKQQLDFLNEIQQTRNAELLYLTAILSWKLNKNEAESIEKLDAAMDVHRQDVASQAAGLEMYVKLNPCFMLDLVREYMQHCRSEPPEPGISRPDPIADKARRVLDFMLRHVPGSIEGQLLRAKLMYIAGDTEKATQLAHLIIRQDNSCADVHMLLAHIHIHTSHLSHAHTALDHALSLDFDIRYQPQYSLLKGKIHLSLGEYAEALQVLEDTLKALKNDPSKQGRDTFTGQQKELNLQDQVSLYLQAAQVHLKLKNVKAAESTVREAMQHFRNSVEAGRVTIALAMLTARSDVDSALEILRSVPSNSDYFLKARAQMASLYLTQRHNRRAFAQCYEDLVEAYPSVTSFMQLGEAYMSIQESEKAIVAFQKARVVDPNNPELAVKIGRALITTHDYQRAIKYYKDAVAADPQRTSLRHDLATLYWKLSDLPKAESLLKEGLALRKNTGNEDIPSTVEKVGTMLLLAKVYRSGNDMKPAVECLIQAKVFQNTVISKMQAKGEAVEVVYYQRAVCAQICHELGEYYNEQRMYDKALGHYNDAVKLDELHDRAMLALVKLYLRRGDLEGCECQCQALLRVMPTCEEAIMVLADLMFRKNKFEDAAFHFQQLLDKKPDNYKAMVQYIQLLRRAGRLQDASKVLDSAEGAQTRGKIDPGLRYAKGLYHRYSNNAREALKELNFGRNPKDGPWSEPCTIAMVEIYINPDNANLWDEADENQDVAENVRTAERLLRDVKNAAKKQILEGYMLIASKKKDNMEKAVAKFYEIMQATMTQQTAEGEDGQSRSGDAGEKVNVPALVGMATALQAMKQTPKARNHLKRVAKANYNAEEDDDYERGWLLLADIYVESGKYDLAQELLKRALSANKSCPRAWELMGLIYEKEQSYRDAAECYENAWRLTNEVDPGIGYKLGFNYMKAKRFVNAIDTCQKVLKSHPEYPKIRKDILDRSRASLRP